MGNWLSEKEQYQENLNNEEISRIKDPVLREIRMRHWKYRTRIFLDEHNISDEELMKLSKKDWEIEKQEIENYKKNIK